MFHAVSWLDFLQTITLIVIPYYVLVVFCYFKKEVYNVFTFRRIPSQPGFNIKSRKDAVTLASTNKVDNIPFTTVHELLEELKMIFKKAVDTKMIKEELLQAIRSKLNMYPRMRETGLKDDINIHITEEAKEICNLEIFPEDLKIIWNL
jgi:hypothetical protein